jgi:hypothetical protein
MIKTWIELSIEKRKKTKGLKEPHLKHKPPKKISMSGRDVCMACIASSLATFQSVSLSDEAPQLK